MCLEKLRNMSEDTVEWLKNIIAETDLPLYIEKLRERTQYYKEESMCIRSFLS